MHIRLVLLLLALSTHLLQANASNEIFAAAERHARQFAGEQTGKTQIEAGPLDTSHLSHCEKLETYTPPNVRAIGRTHIGVRCLEAANWNILVPVRIAVIGNYLTATRVLAAGQKLQPDDLALASGDLANLPAGTLHDSTEAIGKTLRNSLSPGQALRANQLIAPLVIHRGQNVKVISSGKGFSIKAEGKAANNAAEGELVRVRMQSGRTISGIAQSDGSIILSN
jgi:flagella basal body P-ring formation protein FlgA